MIPGKSKVGGKMQKLTPTFVKKWRKERGISARVLGIEIGYSRVYIKRIEGGALKITDRFARRFTEFQNQRQTEEYRTHQIQSRYPLPHRIRILAKPRRCSICREWFIFPMPNQRTCSDDKCQHEAARRSRAGRKKRM